MVMSVLFMFQCISNLINPLAQQIDRATRTRTVPAELVEACAPYLSAFNEQLGSQQSDLVKLLRWPNEGDAAYARQRIAEAPDQSWSLYAITWLPGQYTPIHDHGTWGVVTVLQGRLFEHQMARLDEGGDDGIDLVPAGVCVLTPGAINSFIPEPDHIHYTGVPHGFAPTVSIHLYGRLMTSYHAYDLKTRSRYQMEVE